MYSTASARPVATVMTDSVSAPPLPLHEPVRPADAAALWTLLDQNAPAGQHAPHLGDALLRRGLIDRPSLLEALAEQRKPGGHRLLGELLVGRGVLSEAQLRVALAEWLGVRVIDPRDFSPEPRALALLPRAVAERDAVVPLALRDETLAVLVTDPWDHTLLEQLQFATQHHILPVMAWPGTLAELLQRAYAPTAQGAPAAHRPGGAAATQSVHELAAELSNAPEDGGSEVDVISEADSALVRMINALIQEAIKRRASDIHIEAAEAPRPLKIRLRIDGELHPFLELPARLRFAVVGRIKVMAELDIAEHRKPQDGKIDFSRFGGPAVELRVVTVPTSRGLEDVVLRLLSGLKPMPLDQIGLSAPNLAALRKAMMRPHGLILICGPTGCGKTTTLHSVMRELNTDERKIWTAEDPIEIAQEGLRQVQVNPRIGWNFAAAMRTFLRADPDVIMIGEMRDAETAGIAVEASLTGHLVLSTLHTNSAPESITRLLEIGLDPYNFSDSLIAILAQRLVRRLCPHCREAYPANTEQLLALAAQTLPPSQAADTQRLMAVVDGWRRERGEHLTLWRRGGCERCAGAGLFGRLGVHELMVADDTIRSLIRRRAGADELQAAALAAGMHTLRQDGVDKVLAGLTDLPEVIAATTA
jgi:type II secretory ATPase GspE/PulE/Tfp pilus assembly ATPase PilB-like protein